MSSLQNYRLHPRLGIKGIWGQRQLLWQLTKREVMGRYRGSLFGLTWSFLNPLVMLIVYTFVFSVVFKARWNTGSDSKFEFALALFIGMIAHGLLAECLKQSPSLIRTNVNYVKKVVFPLEILPLTVLGSALFHMMASLFIWSIFFLLKNHFLHWTVLFIPIVFTPLILYSMGIAWFLASFGVYLRDVSQITGVLTTILLFMSPVFYPASILPEPYRTIFYFNPLTFIIEQAREVLMWGNLPNWSGLGLSLGISSLIAWLGFAWFQKTRRGFADVL